MTKHLGPHLSLRSLDAPGLFLALVVCGDGHRWRRFHGCAHGCLCGKVAAQGDAFRVRRLLLLPVDGIKGVTGLPSQTKSLSCF